MRNEVVRPLLIFQKFLSHEEHRDTRRGQAEASRDACSAACKPGAWMLRIAEPGNSLLPSVVDNVVIFRPCTKRHCSLNLSGQRPFARPVMLSGRSSDAFALPMTS